MTKSSAPRYRTRKIGSKHDYIRRYGVLDFAGQFPKRVDGVPGGLDEHEARDLADQLNDREALHAPGPLAADR